MNSTATTHSAATHTTATTTSTPERHAHIRPWCDPAVDTTGYDPRGWYFERYWLGVIGPTATLIMRRLADRFDEQPDGFVLNLGHCAATMGLAFRDGPNSPFGRALERCVMFGLARSTSDGLMVRRFAPRVAQRHLDRLPDDVRAAHDDWARRTEHLDVSHLTDRLTGVGVPLSLARRVVDRVRLAS